MSDEPNTPPSHDDLVKAAKKADRQALRRAPYLLTDDGARRVVEENSHRYVAFSSGIVRALMPTSNSQFYEVSDTADPRAAFVAELARSVPDEDRLEAVAQRQQNIQELNEEKAASGQYRM